MGIVAVGTDNLAFTDWVVRNHHAISALVLVTGKANLGLSFLVEYLVMLGMSFMARGTCYVVDLVRAASPVSTFRISSMTGKTGGVLCRH